MSDDRIGRRSFLNSFLAGLSILTLDWTVLPKGSKASNKKNEYDAIIIGSGLGGLSCAAAFARQGFKPLVLEQHNKPGGYATTFKRPGGFVFDVSLHSTTIRERDGVYNLIPSFPEIKDVVFHPHPNLYRVVYPDYDIRVPQRDIQKYITILTQYFPAEKEGIENLIKDMEGISQDIGKISQSDVKVDPESFHIDFPYLFKCYNKTWGELVDEWIKNPKLKAIISAQWGYYGLPPSKLASYYYALPAIGYLRAGGFYPHGRSQDISNALVKFIENHGGKVLLKTRVDKILTQNNKAFGIKTADDKEFKGKVIISNANTHDTFHKLLDNSEILFEFTKKLDQLSVSISCIQIFLGLKEDLVSKSGIPDSEIFYSTGYDCEAEYLAHLNADVENCGYGLTLYDNIYKEYSPEGKNTVNIIALQGFDHWKKFEKDYFTGKKTDYLKEKEKMAKILISRTEETFLPGLSKAIEVMEIGTPLTNLRYTSNYKGAMYGFNQTLDNSGQNRLPHDTPIKNLYLSGAWTRPGHGYGGVLWSGIECFGEIMQKW